MEDALAAGLLKQLQPAFYIIGAFAVLFVLTFGATIFKLIWEIKKTREQKIDGSLEGLKKAVIENTNSINKLEIRLEMTMSRYEKDLNNLGNKFRAMNS